VQKVSFKLYLYWQGFLQLGYSIGIHFALFLQTTPPFIILNLLSV